MTAPPLTFRGRLPGVDCQPALPAGEQPIRLDVAGFVGFAKRGPVDVPVPIEDPNQYLAVFGGDLALAADAGVPVYANLPAAVRAFFDNGGRRCYVVRVAGPGRVPATLPVPGMRAWFPDGTLEPVTLDAAWPGAWSAGVQAGTQLLETPLAVTGPYRRAAGGLPGRLSVSAALGKVDVGAGDVVRLDLGPATPALLLAVASVGPVVGNVLAGERSVVVATEIPVESGTPVGIAALAGLPADLPVVGAWLQRLDLVVRRHTETGDEQLELWPDLAFTAGNGHAWTDVLQPADATAQPDLTRSLTLRAPDTAPPAYVPLGMDQLGTAAEFDTSPPDGSPGSDGLDTYDPVACYLDPDLLVDTVYDLLQDAALLTVLAKNPKQLRGVHALIGIDEVALIAVPDAVQRGWSPAPPPLPPEPPLPPPPPPPVDTSHFHCCVQPTPPLTAPPDPLAAPPDPIPALPILDEITAFDAAPMTAVQTALVTMCAARADLVAVLCVPQHYDAVRVLDWFSAFTAQPALSASGSAVPPLAHAGYWHPWPQLIEPSTPQLRPLRPVPPDGAVCGMIAARELARGVWVGPANQPLRGPAALTPQLSTADTGRLFNAHANLLVRQPGVVTTTSAHTMCADRTQVQVSVRRLLILLRKIALRYGQRYVFEVNNDRFRRLVQLRFTRILADLAQRGAFLAFRVATDSGVNTAADLDAGRLVVSLQIAPSNPVEFITVTLSRSGEGLLDVVEG